MRIFPGGTKFRNLLTNASTRQRQPRLERRSRDPAEEAVGVLGPTAAIIGSLQALEALRLLAGRGPAYSEKLLYFDGESGRMDVIPL